MIGALLAFVATSVIVPQSFCRIDPTNVEIDGHHRVYLELGNIGSRRERGNLAGYE